MRKKLTRHCRQCPSDDDHFSTCGLLTMSIFWKVVKKSCNNSLNGWRKRLPNAAWKSALTKAKSSSSASSQCHPPLYGWTEKCYKKSTSSNTWDPSKAIMEHHLHEVRIRLAQARSAMTKLAVVWKTKPSVFLKGLNSTNHSSCQYFSTDVRSERWLRIWRD